MINLYPLLDITLLSKTSVTNTNTIRLSYDYSNRLESELTQDDKLYFLHIDSSGFEKLIARYDLFPDKVDGFSSIGLEPYNEDDIWTEIMTADEFETYLYDYNYTHLYTSNVNEEFTRNYGHLFPNNQPYNGVLYKVVIDSKSKSVNLIKVE